MAQSTSVRAIYRAGTLHLLDPVDLPDGIEIEVELPVGPPRGAAQDSPLYPTRPQPPETLARVKGMMTVGGDALTDSEAVDDGNGH